MSQTSLNRALSTLIAETSGKRYCRSCNAHRPLDGGEQPKPPRPWKCGGCVAKAKAHRRRIR